MPLMRGFTDEIKMFLDNVALGAPAGELLSETLERIGRVAKAPVSLRASFPPDSRLHIGKSIVPSGDGGGKSVPPIDDIIPDTLDTTIDFQTGATTGQTVTVAGGAFALPAGTVGLYRRFVLVLRNDGTIDTSFSSEAASLGALSNAGTMLASLITLIPGLFIGWLDLECDDAGGKYRTAGSASAIIENTVGLNSRINRFEGGGGGGAGTNWNTLVKSAAYDLVNYDEVLADSTSGPFILTLPSSPNLGDRVWIIDMKGTWETNNVTVERNGNNIAGIAENLILNVNQAWVYFLFDGVDNWLVRKSVNIFTGGLGEVPAGGELTVPVGGEIVIPSE